MSLLEHLHRAIEFLPALAKFAIGMVLRAFPVRRMPG
jgi:hypothetical protein